MMQFKYTFLVKTGKRTIILQWIGDESFEDGEYPAWVLERVYEETIGRMMDEKDCGIDEIPVTLSLSEEEFQRILKGE